MGAQELQLPEARRNAKSLKVEQQDKSLIQARSIIQIKGCLPLSMNQLATSQNHLQP